MTTASLIALLVIFVISLTLYGSYIFVHQNLKCIIMPYARFQLCIMLMASGGITAVLNPLVFILFSGDVRKAFVEMCTRVLRWNSSRSSPDHFD